MLDPGVSNFIKTNNYCAFNSPLQLPYPKSSMIKTCVAPLRRGEMYLSETIS
jgi:hypothetical protein